MSNFTCSKSEKAVVCRFCAKAKCKDEILCFAANLDVLNNCLVIIEFFKIDYISLTNEEYLPKTICKPCYILMQNAYSFFKMVKQSQTILSNKNIDEIKIECPDEIKSTQSSQVKIEKSYVSLYSISVEPELKPKISKKLANLQPNRSENPTKFNGNNLDVKHDHDEPKIESVDLPDHTVDADNIGFMYAGLDIFSEHEKSWSHYSWKCCHCTSRFPTLSLLRCHSKDTHSTCYAFSCDDCTDTTETFDDFIEHVRGHKHNLRYFCRYCDCYNQTIEECIAHEQNHKNYCVTCNLCGDLFESTKLLVQHKKRVIKQYKEISDDSLSSIEFNDSSFDIPPSNYVIESWKDYPWICRLCNIAFKHIDYWRSHNKSEHQKCAAYKCFDCDGYRPKKLRHLIAHIRQHRRNLSLQCHICNEVKEYEEALAEHVNLHQYHYFSCEMCGENFTDQEELNKHSQMYNKKQLRRLRPLTLEELTCKVCNKVLKSRRHFWSHKAMHKKQIYPCDRCGKLFKNKNTLENHMSRYNKKYECDICGRCFAQKVHVSKHLVTHTDEKPFCCDTCGFKCRDIFKLRQHKLRHTTYTPFICVICNKGFKAAFYLKRHEVQHTGEKPYACKFCDRTFANIPNRHKHMKRIHGQLVIKNNT